VASNSKKNLLGAVTTVLGNGSAGDPLLQLTQQLQAIYQTNETLIEATNQNTRTAQTGSSSGTTAQSVLNSINQFFGAGLGLSPLISGIASLFGGGGSSAPAALVRFALPPAVQEQAGISEAAPTSASGIDYGAGGVARSTTPAAAAPAQITVQVQAMDSQSFLDHSQDIALAVRQAMLESSVLSDVISGA
jgi:hypothetical protein